MDGPLSPHLLCAPTGFGNPRFEGANKKSSGGGSMNVTSPKAILGAISNAAGFSNPTRQQLERSLSQEKVASHAALPSAATSLEGSSRWQHAWPLPPCLLQQGSEHSFPQDTASCFPMPNNIFCAQVDAYGGEDDRPSGYQPRTFGTGLSAGTTSYSSPELTASPDGSEEVSLLALQASVRECSNSEHFSSRGPGQIPWCSLCALLELAVGPPRSRCYKLSSMILDTLKSLNHLSTLKRERSAGRSGLWMGSVLWAGCARSQAERT